MITGERFKDDILTKANEFAQELLRKQEGGRYPHLGIQARAALAAMYDEHQKMQKEMQALQARLDALAKLEQRLATQERKMRMIDPEAR